MAQLHFSRHSSGCIIVYGPEICSCGAAAQPSAGCRIVYTAPYGKEYFSECRPWVFCLMWDAEKTCGMRYNLRNGKMQKSHLTAYKLSLASIATIYIHNTSSAVSASDILIVYLCKYLFVRKISGVQRSCF